MGVSSFGLNNLFETANAITVSTEVAGFEKENVFDYNTFDSWKPSAVPANIAVDMGSAVSLDYWGFYSRNIGDVNGNVTFQYSDDNSVWVTVGTTLTPNNNKPVMKLVTSISHRYYRFLIDGAISNWPVMMMGTRLNMPRGLPIGSEVLTMSRNDRMIVNVSEGGNRIGNTVVSTGAKGSIQLRSIPSTWMRTNWLTLAEHLKLKLALFQWNNDFFPNETLLCWAPSNIPTPSYSGHNTLDVTIPIEGINQ